MHRRSHRSLVTKAIDPPVEELQPETLHRRPVHGFRDDEPASRDAHRLGQDGLWRLAVVQRQQQERRVEPGVAERQANAIVDDIGHGRAPVATDVDGARPEARASRERGRDVRLGASDIEHPRAHDELLDVGDLAPRVTPEGARDEAGHDRARIDASRVRASGASCTV